MSYDAIVAGGGLVGLSVAWQLGVRGVKTLLLERTSIGAGTSARGMGSFTQQLETDILIALSQLSLPILKQLGRRIDFHQSGYLSVALSAQTDVMLREQVDFQRAHGVPVEFESPDTLRERFPYVQTGDVVSAAFCHLDGYAWPQHAIRAFAEEARAYGVDMLEGITVTGVQTVAGRVAGVETNRGAFHAPVVVNAAGPWAMQVAAMAGVAVPVVPLKRQIWHTEPTDAVPADAPLLIEVDTGWYMRPYEGGLLLAMASAEQPGDESLELDIVHAERMLRHARQRLPAFGGELSQGWGGWAGLYAVTPDEHPILGPSDTLPGFYLACGFGGYGFMHAPAAGLLLAALICGETPAVDIAPLGLERFAVKRA